MAVVVMILTIIPCIDQHYDLALNQTSITEQSPVSHPADQDNCSPFCTCQCCQTNVDFPTFFIPQVTATTINQHVNLNQQIINNYSFEFYTPPKA
jgi:hypothetical protein